MSVSSGSLCGAQLCIVVVLCSCHIQSVVSPCTQHVQRLVTLRLQCMPSVVAQLSQYLWYLQSTVAPHWGGPQAVDLQHY